MKGKKKWIIPLVILAVIAAGLAGWWMIVVNNIADEVIIEAGSMPLASDYLIRDLGKEASFVTDPAGLDLTTPGTYDVQIQYNGRIYDTILRVRDSVAPVAQTRALTAFATQRPEPEDFITELQDATDVTVSYQTEPDMTISGDQKLVLLLTDEGGNVTNVEVTLNLIQDNTPPQIHGVEELHWYMGYPLDYLAGVTVTDDLDPEVSVTVDDSAVKLDVPGTYELVYSAQDICGNRAQSITSITVLEDHKGPEILGAIDRSLYLGSTIAYRSGILVRDDVDEAPRLTVDSSAVDLSKPGTYPLTYHAVDGAGNETSVQIQVTVHDAVSYYVEESVIHEEADRILVTLITEDMSVKEQVETIYRWTRENFRYSSYSEKRDWKQSGYQLLKKGYGDCFSFFGLSKLMFERLGIPNIDVRRLWTYSHTSDHFWNMVSIDGGENWYYYDSTPFPGENTWFCLVTDADLDAFSARLGNYFSRDRSILPSTPLERP